MKLTESMNSALFSTYIECIHISLCLATELSSLTATQQVVADAVLGSHFWKVWLPSSPASAGHSSGSLGEGLVGLSQMPKDADVAFLDKKEALA